MSDGILPTLLPALIGLVAGAIAGAWAAWQRARVFKAEVNEMKEEDRQREEAKKSRPADTTPTADGNAVIDEAAGTESGRLTNLNPKSGAAKK